MENPSMAADPEASFLASKQQTGNEWELYKENVRPLKRGRNVHLLNRALRSQTDNAVKKSLLETRRRYIEAIHEYKGEDPLQPWIDCIKWVQESFPTGGDCSGLIVIYEQCVRTFWHEDSYKDDLRYLKVWLEYADNCVDAEVIYRFLEVNEIGQNHSVFYLSYALHMESKNKLIKADEIFNLGIARRAKPSEKLEATYMTFLARSTRKKRNTEDDSTDNHLSVRAFGTVLTAAGASRQIAENSDLVRKRVKLQRIDTNVPLSIYKDANSGASHQPENHKSKDRVWHTLGGRSDRNKENTSIPSKWVSYKIPQKPGATPRPTTPCIEVFVDEECAKLPSGEAKGSPKQCTLQLRQANDENLKRETELLKENPLRNFHLSSLR